MSGVIYFLLLTIVDDFGRYDARPAILKSELFPFLIDLVRESDVQRSLETMSRAGLVRLYSHDGKPFLEIQKFRQRLRAHKSKWPAPPSNAGQCHDNAMTMPTDTDSETDTEKETKPPEKPPADPPPVVPRQQTNIQKVVRGFQIMMKAENDVTWNKVYFRRFSKPASELLTLFSGDVGKVLDCVEAVAFGMEKKHLSWTPETIVTHAGDWKNGRLLK